MSRLILGCDPGASTGFALCRFDDRGTLREVTAGTVKRPRPCKSRSDVQADMEHFWALRQWVEVNTTSDCGDVAVECPRDISDAWQGSGARRGHKVARGTGFLLGAAYGRLLSALDCTFSTLSNEVTAYPVRGSAKDPGWMTGLFGQKITREYVYTMLGGVARTAGAPDLTEDQLAAMGVAVYHATRTRRTKWANTTSS